MYSQSHFFECIGYSKKLINRKQDVKPFIMQELRRLPIADKWIIYCDKQAIQLNGMDCTKKIVSHNEITSFYHIMKNSFFVIEVSQKIHT